MISSNSRYVKVAKILLVNCDIDGFLIIFASMKIDMPNVSRKEKRIGSVFNELFSVINQLERTDDDITLDFKNASFFHPFFLAAFSIYNDNMKRKVERINICSFMRSYFDVIHFETPYIIESREDLSLLKDNYSMKSYLPICKFSLHDECIDYMQTSLQEIIESQLGTNVLKGPLSYLLSELICNMQQHSQAEYGYLFSQYLPADNVLNLCLADNGITIYGSYVRTAMYLDRIETEADALRFAIDGYSTKERPDAEKRGYGISTNCKMFVEGLGGDFFILSGGAFHRHDRNANVHVNLPGTVNWPGTIILVKIPVKIKRDFNIYNYIQ